MSKFNVGDHVLIINGYRKFDRELIGHDTYVTGHIASCDNQGTPLIINEVEESVYVRNGAGGRYFYRDCDLILIDPPADMKEEEDESEKLLEIVR